MKRMHPYLPLAITGAVFVSACTPANIRPIAKPDPGKEATVVVYRSSSFYIGGVSMILGVDGTDVAKMDNSTITTLELPAGTHDLYVRSNKADSPFHFPAVLQAGQKLCLEGKPSDADMVTGIVPFARYATSMFQLYAAPCLTDEAAKAYEAEPVQYQP